MIANLVNKLGANKKEIYCTIPNNGVVTITYFEDFFILYIDSKKIAQKFNNSLLEKVKSEILKRCKLHETYIYN